MTTLISQRDTDDCTICCIAMATGIPYERVLDVASNTRMGYRYEGRTGTISTYHVLLALGVKPIKSFGRPWGIHGEYFQNVIWGRRAILEMPSLNGFGGCHAVYWDGAHLHDPTNGKKYDDELKMLVPISVILFDETHVPPRVDDLYEALKHGDHEHQAWLHAALTAYFRDEPVPAPYGMGTREAKLTTQLSSARLKLSTIYHGYQVNHTSKWARDKAREGVIASGDEA